MFSDLNVDFLLNDLVELINDSIHLSVFHLENNVWNPWNPRLPKSGKEYPGIKRSFIVIGRIEELWRRYVTKRLITQIEIGESSLSNSQTSLSFNSNIFGASLNSSTSSQLSSNIKELRKVRLLLKQTPYDYNLLNASSTLSGTNVLNSSNMNNGLPEFCQVSSSVIVPRQMLCIIKVNGCKVDTIAYNMAKELSEQLYNAIDTILKNHKSRSQMLNFFIYQKLGLFYETSCKSSLQPMSINTIKSLLQIPPVKGKLSSNIVELNRERKPSGPTRSFSPSASLTDKTISNNQNKSSKNHVNKYMTTTINLSRLYQDVYTITHLSGIKKPDSVNDIIYQHGIQFLTTYNLERQRRLFSKKIRHAISFLQPTIGFKQSELSENESPQQQLDVFSSLKGACRIFHSVVCPILFIPNVRKRLLDSFNKLPEKSDQLGEHSPDDDWIYEMSRLVLAYYADYVQKEHGFQFINPPRLNMSQNPGSHALFQKVSNNSGIHIIEVFILKGCLCVRLNLLEIRRINHNIPNFTSSLNNFPNAHKSFVKDACKYCDLTHLVSFMYDVYVRMIVKSISYPDENKKNFNPISFIHDLVKMHSQPPLYATSHLYLMPFPVPTDRIKPDNLFEFLQRHCDDYNFSICSNHYSQENPDCNTSFLYNIIEDNYSPMTIMGSRKISPSSSSPMDVNSTDSALSYKYLENNNEWDLTSIFCLTRSNQNPESCFDLFIITLNRSMCFPHQRLIPIANNTPKSSTFLATYLTILPHTSSNPANLLHLNPCPITLTHIDVNNMPESVAWRTYDNRSIIPLQVPLFLSLRAYIKKYFIESNEKFEKAITDCHKDFLWHRMYQRSENLDLIKFSLTFEEFQDLINSGDVIDILELDNRLMESMKIAASYLKELNDYMGILSDDCYTVLYENTTSICHMSHGMLASHLVLMSKKTNDGFLLLSKNQESNSSSDAYHVQLKAIFRVQDCRSRVPLQRKYFSSSLKDITVMLAETAAFCIWRKLAMKPLNSGK